MIRRAKKSEGFTLIELMLALAFVAFILIFATTTIIQIMRTYNKGLAVKEINQTGRSTLEEMTRIIKGANPNVVVTSALTDSPATSQGRVCFGGVSYVWNFTNTNANQYTDNSRVNFARVNDPGSALCKPISGNFPRVDKTAATELLSSNVWVQQLTVTPAVGGSFYDIFLQLSTVDDPTNSIFTYNWSNPAPEQRVVCRGGNVGEYCAVVSFSTTVNARGGVQ